MKKSTILIILVVFAVSVFVVGFWGIQNVPYEEIIYVEQITPTHVFYGRQSDEAEIKFDEQQKYFYVNFPYEEGMTVKIDYEITPHDVTNRRVDIEIENLNPDSDAVLNSMGTITLNNRGPVIITYRAKDSASGPTMTIWLFPE